MYSMQPETIIAFSGTPATGTLQEITRGTSENEVKENLGNTTMEPGVVYQQETVFSAPIGGFIGPIQEFLDGWSNPDIDRFYYDIRSDSVITQYRLKAGGSSVRAKAAILLALIVIGILIAISISVIIISKVLGCNPLNLVMNMNFWIGMGGLMGGGIIAGILPKIAKLGALVPMGIGGYFLYHALVESGCLKPPTPPVPPGEKLELLEVVAR